MNEFSREVRMESPLNLSVQGMKKEKKIVVGVVRRVMLVRIFVRGVRVGRYVRGADQILV